MSPAVVATGLGLIGTFASVAGNEAAIRLGRKRLVVTAMVASIIIGATIGFVGSLSYALAAILLTLYGVVIWLDSLIADSRYSRHGRAIPAGRDARGAFHARLCGRVCRPAAGGLDARSFRRACRASGWGLSFLSVAVLMVIALVTFWVIRPRELEGDKRKAT